MRPVGVVRRPSRARHPSSNSAQAAPQDRRCTPRQRRDASRRVCQLVGGERAPRVQVVGSQAGASPCARHDCSITARIVGVAPSTPQRLPPTTPRSCSARARSVGGSVDRDEGIAHLSCPRLVVLRTMQPRLSPPRRSLQRCPPRPSWAIVANPASGRDIRRLVAGASVFGNADKAGMVFRLLAGLGADRRRARADDARAATGSRPRCTRQLRSRARRAAARRSRSSRSSTMQLDRHRRRTRVDAVERCARPASPRSSSSAATAPTASWPRRAATCRSAPSRPVPTTSSPRCARRPSPGWRPGSSPPGAAVEHAPACARRRSSSSATGGADLALVDVAVSARALRRRTRPVAPRGRLRELFVDASPTPAPSGSRPSPGSSRRCSAARTRAARAPRGDRRRPQRCCRSPLAPGLVTPGRRSPSFAALEPGERGRRSRPAPARSRSTASARSSAAATTRATVLAHRRPAAASTSTPSCATPPPRTQRTMQPAAG